MDPGEGVTAHETCSHEQELERLASAVRGRDDFISLVGHELRNSIAPLMMLAEQFETSPTGIPPSRVAVLLRNLRRFVSTVDRVTEVAQIQRGSLDLELAEVDLVTVVKDVIADVEAQARAGNAVFVLDMPPSLKGTWSYARLRQIVCHLVSNAIRHAGGGTIEISVRDTSDGISSATLTVRDHGPGIPPDQLVDLFDRIERPRSKVSGGLGVGLYVVGSLVKAMHGSVRCDNSLDGGACFSVMLPRG